MFPFSVFIPMQPWSEGNKDALFYCQRKKKAQEWTLQNVLETWIWEICWSCCSLLPFWGWRPNKLGKKCFKDIQRHSFSSLQMTLFQVEIVFSSWVLAFIEFQNVPGSFSVEAALYQILIVHSVFLARNEPILSPNLKTYNLMYFPCQKMSA
jgi:hypothetical protein